MFKKIWNWFTFTTPEPKQTRKYTKRKGTRPRGKNRKQNDMSIFTVQHYDYANTMYLVRGSSQAEFVKQMNIAFDMNKSKSAIMSLIHSPKTYNDYPDDPTTIINGKGYA